MTIYEVIQKHSGNFPERNAVESFDRQPMTYARLAVETEAHRKDLDDFGIGPGDRIALVVPNGPELAVCFLTLACGTCCAPLNPGYRADEFEFHFSELGIKALIVQRGLESAAVEVARKLKLIVVELVPDFDAPAGVFKLTGPKSPRSHQRLISDSSVALIIHTSGTTGKPKIIALSHGMLTEAAKIFSEILQLSPADRCLNVMPLFHTHGLTGAVLSSIYSGASVFCTTGFLAPQFINWLRQARATWYTAVPSMHQSIVSRIKALGEDISGIKLRVIRSSSSPLGEPATLELEKIFGAPVIDSYGMTEVTPIASTLLPPARRKFGTVGTPIAEQVSIMAENGALLKAGEVGEVVVKGPNVFSGYENNPEGTARAFREGWFLTGDKGFIDEDGFLRLTGRSKEEINRAGEKISPEEIEAVLLKFPAVSEAVVFAVPDKLLGESIGAAIVIKAAAPFVEADLRTFVAQHVAEHKVPRHLKIVQEIPKSSTGKTKRLGMANLLGIEALNDSVNAAPIPADAVFDQKLENAVKSIWCDVLSVPSVQLSDNFFLVGGDSITGSLFCARILQETGLALSPQDIYACPTPVLILQHLQSIKQKPSATLPTFTLSDLDVTGEIPVSVEQKLFLHFAEQAPGAYQNHLNLRFRGALDLAALQSSFEKLIARQEILRTVYIRSASGWTQKVLEHSGFEMLQQDISKAPAPEQERLISEIVHSLSNTPFDLAKGPVIRATLIKRAPDDHQLVIVYSHTGFDRWSVLNFLHELIDLYCAKVTGRPSLISELKVPYSRYAQWQNKALDGKILNGQLGFWRSYLKGFPEQVRVSSRPIAGSNPSEFLSHKSAISRELYRDLKEFSKRNSSSVSTVLLSTFALVLSAANKQKKLLITTPVISKSRSDEELSKIIGCLIDNLIVGFDLSSEANFQTLLKQTSESMWESYEKQVPYILLLENERFPIPRFHFNFLANIPPPSKHKLPGVEASFEKPRSLFSPLQFTNLNLTIVPQPDLRQVRTMAASYDLALGIGEVNDELRCGFWYTSGRAFDEKTVAEIASDFQKQLEKIVTK